MSYIGNTPDQQAFTPAVDFFNGNGSTTAFTLSRPVASVAQVQAVISNVPQTPGDAFTVSGNTITFTSAPPSGTQNIYVYYTSPITQVIAPGQNTVTTTSLMDSSVTTAKIADGAVTPAKLSTGAPTWDAAYNVGIGATPDAVTYPFAGGSFQLPSGVSIYSWAASGMYLQYNAYYNSGWKYKTTGNPVTQVVFGGNGGLYVSGAGSGTAGNAATLVQTLGVENGLSLALQGATPKSGTGITFPATQSASTDANTLDDYEEGTWTPTFGGWTTAGTTTYTGRVGLYTKVGRLVTLKCWIAGTVSGASTDYFSVGGFPFTVFNSGGEESGGIVSYLTGPDMGASGRGWWSYPAANQSRAIGGIFTQTSVSGVNPNVTFSAYITYVYQTP